MDKFDAWEQNTPLGNERRTPLEKKQNTLLKKEPNTPLEKMRQVYIFPVDGCSIQHRLLQRLAFSARARGLFQVAIIAASPYAII
jgi:hypothetical protein